MPTLSATIVVYNGAEEALAAAASVLRHTQKYALTLYLVDNASPDHAGDTLQAALADGRFCCSSNQTVRLICSSKNKGFGGGHNLVLSELDSDYHFILNPDILVETDVLSDMADWMEQHPQAAMARPSLNFPDGKEQILPLRKCSALALLYRQMPWLFFLKHFNDRYVMADADLSKPTQIEFCTGSFAMLRTDVMKKVGGFDEGYFMYVEDADLTQKVRQEGEVYLLPQFTAIHAWHRAPHTDIAHCRMQTKSMMRYFSKWGFRF